MNCNDAAISADEPKQIVRRLKKGEQVPYFTLAEMLMGATAPDPLGKFSAAETGRRGATVCNFKKTEQFMRRMTPHHDAISSMLNAGHSVVSIAAKLGFTRDSITRYMGKKGMVSSHRPVGGKNRYRVSPTRFTEREAEIRRDIASMSIYKVAHLHGFAPRTLTKLLGEKS